VSEQIGAMPSAPVVKIVYVENFSLDPADIHTLEHQPARGTRSGAMPQSPLGPSPLNRLFHSSEPTSSFSSPQDKADHIVQVMRDRLVADLVKAGVKAMPSTSDDVTHHDGWLLRGTFRQVDEGSRALRAMIGFGAGKTTLTVSANLVPAMFLDLPPRVSMEVAAQSGKLPGAMIGLNPYMAVAGFIAASYDTDKDIRNAADRLSKEIVAKLNTVATIP